MGWEGGGSVDVGVLFLWFQVGVMGDFVGGMVELGRSGVDEDVIMCVIDENMDMCTKS